MTARVAQEDADLAGLDPPRRARILPLHAGRLRALLQEPGLVQHEHGTLVTQVLRHVGLQVVTHRVRVPSHPAQEILHPVRRRVPGCLGQLPAVLALNRRQQASQVGRGAPAWLGPHEPRRDPSHHLIQTRRPILHVRLRRHAASPPNRHNAQSRL